jgi:glutamine amidotransferase
VIAVVDYGLGNLGSVTKAFRHLGVAVELSADPARLARAEALVLPGDGAFGATMEEMRRRGLAAVVREAAAAGTPILGICIGMQVLFEESEEHGRHAGFGLLPGRVRRFDGPLPVPHMGWNRLRAARAHPVLAGLGAADYVYFVHSYYAEAEAADVLATSDYGVEFAAVVGRGNLLGMQFHPEKSQAVGLRLVEGFVSWVAARRRPSSVQGAQA